MERIVVFVFVSFSIFSLVYSQVPGTGRCPVHPIKENFSWSKFSGKWYEIERFFAIFEIGKKCVTVQYDELPNGNLRVVNRGVNKWTKRPTSEIGRGSVPYDDEKARFEVRYPRLFVPKISSYSILDTDYETYAVVWSCKKFMWFFHNQYAWVLSRTKTVSEETRIKIYEKLDALGVNRHKFYLTDQANCPDGH